MAMNGERALFAFRGGAPCTNAPSGPVTCAQRRRSSSGTGVACQTHEKNKKKKRKAFGAFRYVGRVTRTETGRTHVHGFEPPVADGLEAELHGLLIPQAAEPLAVDVALVHEDVPFAVVSRHEACDWERHKASVV